MKARYWYYYIGSDGHYHTVVSPPQMKDFCCLKWIGFKLFHEMHMELSKLPCSCSFLERRCYNQRAKKTQMKPDKSQIFSTKKKSEWWWLSSLCLPSDGPHSFSWRICKNQTPSINIFKLDNIINSTWTDCALKLLERIWMDSYPNSDLLLKIFVKYWQKIYNHHLMEVQCSLCL